MQDIIPETTLTEEQKKAYKTNGYIVFKGLLSPDTTKETYRDVMAIMETIGLNMTALKQTAEYLAGGAVDRLVNSPNLQQIATQLMEDDAMLYLPFTAVKTAGGGGAFHYHQDGQYTYFDGPGCNLWFALVPMTEENGCLYMVPHSHYMGRLPSVKGDDGKVKESGIEPAYSVPILMEPGDCVAFTRLTVHGSGQNTSPEHRAAYAVQYAGANTRFSRDKGETWSVMRESGPGWNTKPVETITVPKGKVDGH